MRKTFFPFIILIFFLFQCQNNHNIHLPNSATFNEYWHDHGAEITRFALKQVRYGEIHTGEAVLIYVTEPFLKTKQVKADNPRDPNAIPAFKLNFTKKFTTGLYPYSVMSSYFSSLEKDQRGSLLKLTTSIQEWCGHAFMQLNQSGKGYQLSLKSYFETEGDVETSLKSEIVEDAIWNTIRLSPKQLPTGEILILPSSQFLRLLHVEAKSVIANAKLKHTEKLSTYTLSYPSHARELSIEFEKDFPHRILGWTESYPSRGKNLTTTAKRTHAIMAPYWEKNKLEDLKLRKKIGLQY